MTSNRARVALAGLAALVCGCAGPIAGPSGKTNTSATRAKPAKNSASVTAGDSASGPVSRMTVQNETVEATDLWRGLRSELQAKTESDSPLEFRTFLAQRAAQLISDKIAESLLYQKASLRQTPEMEKKINAYVDGEIRKVVTADHGGMQRRYEKYLESQGTTLEEARTQFRRQFIIAGFLEGEVRPKVAEPTRADLLAAFESQKDAWRRPARRSMSLIDVRVDELLPQGVNEPTREQVEAAREEARSRIKAALSEIQNGNPFAEVARRYSHGHRAAEGGAWGWVNPESIRERFRPAIEALDALAAGKNSDILETPDGFFVVRCDRLEPAFEPDFAAVQPQLKEIYFRRAFNQRIADLVSELRSKSRVEPADLERYHEAVVQAGFGVIQPNDR